MAEAFQVVADEYREGRTIRGSVSMPPRAGKSYITSLYCAWWLGQFPETSVMRNTCTARLYEKFSYNVRDIVRSDKFKQVFPNAVLSPDKQALEGWNLTTAKQVSYFGAGVGGTIIGFGASIAITDDLYKDMADALSPTVQEGVSMWKESAHDSRMERGCPEIFIGTRWSKRDEIGKAIDKGLDFVIIISALDEDDNSFCEDVNTTEYYRKRRDEIDEAIWMAEYMQQPVEVKGLLFPESELTFYNPATVTAKTEHKAVFVDPADKGGDYYAAPLAYLVGDVILIDRVIFSTAGVDVTIPETVDMITSEKVDSVQVEINGGWTLASKDIKKEVHVKHPNCNIRSVSVSTNKETRILTQSSWIKRYVRFREDYRSDKQYSAFMKNLTSYLREGKNAHDDAADVMAQLAEWHKKQFSHLW